MAHMAECDSCRYLFEDYHVCEEALAETAAEDRRPMPSVAFALASGAVRPALSPYLDAGARAHVLGNAGAAWSITACRCGGATCRFEWWRPGRGARLEIRSADDSAAITLSETAATPGLRLRRRGGVRGPGARRVPAVGEP
jgi:hypothetical protein